MRINLLSFTALGTAALLTCLPCVAHADVLVNTLGDARLVTEGSGARDDNNGGNAATGALIGLNTGGVDNFMIYDFSDLSATSGITVTGATVTFAVATGFVNSNHGSAADLINLHEIALGNLGWVQGTGVITASDTPADDGSVSYLNRAQFNGSGTTEAWVDTGGSGVANVTGSFITLGSQAGWADSSTMPTLTFAIDAVTAQGWVDNGLGGIALSTTDDGDSKSRYNFLGNGAQINFIEVPEPGSLALLGLGGLVLARRRR